MADAPLELENSLTVSARDYGQTVGHIGSLPDLVAAFLAAGTTDALDTRCALALPEPAFLIP